jgi:hypothetical protein
MVGDTLDTKNGLRNLVFRNPLQRPGTLSKRVLLRLRVGVMLFLLLLATERMALVRAEVIARDGEADTLVFLDARFDSSRDGYHQDITRV